MSGRSIPPVRVSAGQRIELRPNAPKPHTVPAGFRIAFEDAHLVVIEKPSGITSVPYERKETGTALDLIRASWKRAGKRATVTPLYTVHRIDKDTSGLLVVRQDQARRARAARGLPAPHRHPRLPGRRRRGRDRGAHRIAAGRRPRRRHPGLHAAPARRPTGHHLRGTAEALRAQIDGAGRASGLDRRYTLPRATRDRTNASDSHPPLRARPPAGRRDGLHPRSLARRSPAPPRASPHVARGVARLSAPRDRRADQPAGRSRRKIS